MFFKTFFIDTNLIFLKSTLYIALFHLKISCWTDRLFIFDKTLKFVHFAYFSCKTFYRWDLRKLCQNLVKNDLFTVMLNLWLVRQYFPG